MTPPRSNKILTVLLFLSLVHSITLCPGKPDGAPPIASVLQSSARFEISDVQRIWDGGSVLITVTLDSQTLAILFKRPKSGIGVPKIYISEESDSSNLIEVLNNQTLERLLTEKLVAFIEKEPESRFTHFSEVAVQYMNDSSLLWNDSSWHLNTTEQGAAANP